MNPEASSRPRVLITRTRHQASALAAQLEALGAETILIPTIEVVAPTSFAKLDDAIVKLGAPENEYDWLVFTSANAVHAVANRTHEQSLKLHPKQIAAIGPATLKAVEGAGLIPQIGSILLPERYVAESLAEALLTHADNPFPHYLVVRAEEARDIIPAMLEAAGYRVTIAAAYRNITPPDTLDALRQTFAEKARYPDVITFTSSSTARNLITLLESIGQPIPAGIALASIGPITSATLRELGYEPTFEAAEPTIESMTHAIAKHLKLS